MSSSELFKPEKVTSLEEMELEVGRWSRHCFSMQQSIPTGHTFHGVMPAMGIGEEIGELFLELEKEEPDPYEVHDALGDIVIYLCDFACRENCRVSTCLKTVAAEELPLSALGGMVVWNGKLMHAVLKWHQGIREYLNKDHYKKQRNKAIGMIFRYLDNYVMSRDFEQTLEYIALDVWQETVSKRDWKKFGSDGVAN